MPKALKGKRLLNLPEAAEHYKDAYNRGMSHGKLIARKDIVIELLTDSIMTTQFSVKQLQTIIERIEK